MGSLLLICSFLCHQVEKDDRSDSEVETESEDEAICEQNGVRQRKVPNGKLREATKNGPVANNNMPNDKKDE